MSEPDIVINLSNLEELNILKARGLKKELLSIIRNRAYRQLYKILNKIPMSKYEEDNKERYKLMFKLLKRIKAIEPSDNMSLGNYILSRNGVQ